MAVKRWNEKMAILELLWDSGVRKNDTTIKPVKNIFLTDGNAVVS